jgi:hypothetical protein
MDLIGKAFSDVTAFISFPLFAVTVVLAFDLYV